VEEGDLPAGLSVLRDGLESSPEEAQSWLLVGRILGELGGYEGAVEAYARVETSIPLIADCAVLLRSDLALRQERFEEAEAGYREGLQRFPRSPFAAEMRMGLGRAAAALGHHRLAIETLEEFLTGGGSEEDRVEALLLIGQSRLVLEDWVGAQETYHRLWKDYPESEGAAAASDQLEWLRTSQGLVLPQLTPEQRFERAERLRRAGELTEAVDEFSFVVESALADDLVSEALFEQGRIYFRLGDNRRALDRLKKLVKRHPDSDAAPDGLYLMARVHWREGYRHRFTSTCKDVLKKYPGTRAAEDAQFALGVFHLERRKTDDARTAFRHIVQGDSSHSRRHDTLWTLGWLEYREARYADALESFALLASEATSGYRKAAMYWSARCQERLGNQTAVAEILRRVVESYLGDHYGIQASARLGDEAGGNAGDRMVPPVDFSLSPGWGGEDYVRVRILEDVGLYDLAMRVMRPLLKGAPPGARLRYAGLAGRAGDYKRAADDMEIYYRSLIETRAPGLPREFWQATYPLPYEEHLFAAAREFGVDPLLVAAVIREESRFDSEAVSSAGAMGLLQLMPGTARDEARRLGVRSRNLDLFEPAVNIRLGTYSLSRRIERFDGNLVLALAGYNAGDQRAKRWKGELKGLETDEFIDQIPYRETRLYIKRILASYDHYRRTYGAETGLDTGAEAGIRIGLTPGETGG
jgi:soluble lytic murein transglycosylase